MEALKNKPMKNKKTESRIVSLLSEGKTTVEIPYILKAEKLTPNGTRSVTKLISKIKHENNSLTLFQLGERLQNDRWAKKAATMLRLAEKEGYDAGYEEAVRILNIESSEEQNNQYQRGMFR